MNKRTLTKRTSLVGYALLILQTFLIFLWLLLGLRDQYISTWTNYLNDQSSYTLYLNNIPPTKKDEILAYLNQVSHQKNFLLVRKENNDDLFNIGVMGTPKTIDVQLSFGGQSLLDKSKINKVLQSSNPNASIGQANGTINQLAPISSFWFSPLITVSKLESLVKNEDTLRGSYQLVGVNDKQTYDNIINQLHKITDIEKSDFTFVQSGSASNGDLLKDSIILGIILTSCGLLAFFLIVFLNNLKEYGNLILLGWSKKDILFKIFKPYLVLLSLTALFLCVFSTIFNLRFPLSFITLGIKTGIVTSFIFSLTFFCAASLVIISKNIALIKGYYPKKLIYSFFFGFYLLLTSVVIGTCLYIDQPAKSISETATQAHQWHTVSKMEVLASMDSGNDSVRSYADTSSKINRDFYDLYRHYANKDGVYFVNSFYASKTYIEQMTDGYKEMPSHPFTILTASPNYLKTINFTLSNQALKATQNGIRVIYLPDNISGAEKRKTISYIKESMQEGIRSSDISTKFTRSRKFKFITYYPQKSIFLWNNTPQEPTVSNSPIIYVASPENFSFVEIGNLFASGLGGSFKFKNSAVRKQVLSPDNLSKYHLADNKLNFATVQQYIDGVQKSLWQTLAMFGLVIILLIILLILLVCVLAFTYKKLNYETLLIKQFLGFSFRQLYTLPLIMISTINGGALIIILISHSKIGVLIEILNLILQLLIFYLTLKTHFAQKNDRKELD